MSIGELDPTRVEAESVKSFDQYTIAEITELTNRFREEDPTITQHEWAILEEFGDWFQSNVGAEE